MSNSFYGEKVYGAFIIEKRYSTIPEMCADFALGEQCEVNYESYVLINTINRDHPDNGKLFRRGFDINNQQRTVEYYENGVEKTRAANGAEYIGTIVGPPGPAPNLNIVNTSAITGGSTTTLSVGNGDLVSGKTNDTIVYTYKTVRESDGSETQVQVGTKIPYLVNEFVGIATGPVEDGAELAIEEDASTVSKPFYSKWNVSIPQGQPGKSIKDVYLWVNNTGADVTYDENKVVHRGQSALLYTLEDNTIHFIKYYNPLEEVKFGNDGHLLARYASQYAEDYTGKTTQTINNTIWVDLGKVLNYNGIYIQGAENVSSGTNAITYLNNKYPNGLTGTNAGKAIVIGDSIYAYDSTNKWFRIGNGLGSAYARPETLSPANDQYLNGMNEQGLWFVIDRYN